MSQDWVADIEAMQQHYGIQRRIDEFDYEMIKQYLDFRVNFLKEEMKELEEAQTAEDVVDALIDLCVVAIGTLAGFRVDAHLAWDRVLEANMSKEVGVKPGRPNPLGLPDLIKPPGWKGPDNFDNVGYLDGVFSPKYEGDAREMERATTKKA